jgi:hypothetical protein
VSDSLNPVLDPFDPAEDRTGNLFADISFLSSSESSAMHFCKDPRNPPRYDDVPKAESSYTIKEKQSLWLFISRTMGFF